MHLLQTLDKEIHLSMSLQLLSTVQLESVLDCKINQKLKHTRRLRHRFSRFLCCLCLCCCCFWLCLFTKQHAQMQKQLREPTSCQIKLRRISKQATVNRESAWWTNIISAKAIWDKLDVFLPQHIWNFFMRQGCTCTHHHSCKNQTKSTDGFNLFHLSSPVFTPFLVAKGTSVNKNNPDWSSRAPHGAKPKCESHCPVPPKINQFLQCWCDSGYISWPPGMIWSCLPVVSMFASSQNGKAITHNIHAAQRSDSPARLSVMGFFRKESEKYASERF